MKFREGGYSISSMKKNCIHIREIHGYIHIRVSMRTPTFFLKIRSNRLSQKLLPQLEPFCFGQLGDDPSIRHQDWTALLY